MVEIITKRHTNSKDYINRQVSDLYLTIRDKYPESQVDNTKGIVVTATFKYINNDPKSYSCTIGHFKYWTGTAIHNYTIYIKVGKQSFWYKDIIENVDKINMLIQQEYLKDTLEKL